MPIDLTCCCGKLLRIADEFAGRQGQCPVCGRVLAIPAPDVAIPGAALPPGEAAQAVTAIPGQAAAEPAPPEHGETPLPRYPGDLWPDAPDATRPPYKLYSPGVVGLSAFL